MQVLRVEVRTMDDEGQTEGRRIFAQRCRSYKIHLACIDAARILPQIYTEESRRSRDIDCPDSEKVNVAVNYDSARLYKFQQIME